ncbi:FAD-dependent oxidoreductase [candidate division KSB1 bacterium]|nr:FAD-dependent oxidoreductase [candidate division KSB1 bacterium]
MMKNIIWLFLLGLLYPPLSGAVQKYNVCIYGGTPSGVIASIAASRNGMTVLLVEQTRHVGGLATSGLNTSETNHMINKAITGIACEFYIRMGDHFSPEYFDTFASGRKLDFQAGDPAFFYESHIAEKTFQDMLAEENIELMYQAYVTHVEKSGTDIKMIVLNDTLWVDAQIFIDCTYEGDLMARSGVSYTYGRESIETYNESLAGIRLYDKEFETRTVDENGELLPYFSRPEGLVPGQGDNRVMNYNFRPTMTQDPDNFVPVKRPENYDSTRYQLLADYLEHHPDTHIWNLVGIYRRGNNKFEFNNQQNAIISLGLFGGNIDYPDADYKRRREIVQDHKDYTLGLLYFLGHDERVPEQLCQEMLSYGFAKDEYPDNNHFPYYLYIREARRMIGDFVGTEHDILQQRSKADAVCLGSHWIDSHHVQRVALSDTTFTNEGRIWEKITQPYELSYRLLLPKATECTNLLVPVCASLSHVAFCSYRLEPTWMQMGHVSGTAAALAIKSTDSLHNLDIDALQQSLVREDMIVKIDVLGPYRDYSDDF